MERNLNEQEEKGNNNNSKKLYNKITRQKG